MAYENYQMSGSINKVSVEHSHAHLSTHGP